MWDAPQPARPRRAPRGEAGADIVVVHLHGGDEYNHLPNADQVALVDRLTRSPDVDLVLGEHAHVVQPITKVTGKWVVYGMGNMVAPAGSRPGRERTRGSSRGSPFTGAARAGGSRSRRGGVRPDRLERLAPGSPIRVPSTWTGPSAAARQPAPPGRGRRRRRRCGPTLRRLPAAAESAPHWCRARPLELARRAPRTPASTWHPAAGRRVRGAADRDLDEQVVRPQRHGDPDACEVTGRAADPGLQRHHRSGRWTASRPTRRVWLPREDQLRRAARRRSGSSRLERVPAPPEAATPVTAAVDGSRLRRRRPPRRAYARALLANFGGDVGLAGARSPAG